MKEDEEEETQAGQEGMEGGREERKGGRYYRAGVNPLGFPPLGMLTLPHLTSPPNYGWVSLGLLKYV